MRERFDRAKKKFEKISKNLLTNTPRCDIMNTSKGERKPREFKKKFQKFQKNLLTNRSTYGIINTSRTGSSPKNRKELILWQMFRRLLRLRSSQCSRLSLRLRRTQCSSSSSTTKWSCSLRRTLLRKAYCSADCKQGYRRRNRVRYGE